MLRIMTSVLVKLMFRSSWCAYLLKRPVFSQSCMWLWVLESRARSSAKSRSSKVEKGVHLMPLGWSSVVRRITQSMAVQKQCRHHAALSDTRLDLKTNTTVLYPTTEGFIEALYNLENPLGNTIGSKYVPQADSVYTVEGLLEIYKVYV